MILPVVLLLALAPAAPALAASSTANKEGLQGYKQKPKPTSEVAPAKEKTAPAKEEPAPASTSTAPAKQEASTLPFTGFNLTWSVGAGLLLIGVGGSIMVMQRRQRRGTGKL